MADGVKVIPTEFTSEDETLRGHFVVPPGDGPFPGICKLHGLPGGSDQVRGIATRLALSGFVVLTFDFRGFRNSDGLFALSSQVKDAGVALSHLLESELTQGSWAGVYAASWGAAVAVCALAEDQRLDALCLRAPVFDTLWFAESPMIDPAVEQIASTDPSQIRGIDDPEIRASLLSRLIEDSRIHNPLNEIPKLSPVPLMIIHGASDADIPMTGVRRLYELAGEPKEMVVVENADHELTDPRAYEITVDSVVQWFSGICPSTR